MFSHVEQVTEHFVLQIIVQRKLHVLSLKPERCFPILRYCYLPIRFIFNLLVCVSYTCAYFLFILRL